MKHIIMAVVMLLISAPGDWRVAQASPATAQDHKTKEMATSQEITFSINKMTCALCPVTVRKAMEKVVGVKNVKIDFTARTATVIFDPSRTTIAKIALASTNAGYPARISAEELP